MQIKSQSIPFSLADAQFTSATKFTVAHLLGLCSTFKRFFFVSFACLTVFNAATWTEWIGWSSLEKCFRKWMLIVPSFMSATVPSTLKQWFLVILMVNGAIHTSAFVLFLLKMIIENIIYVLLYPTILRTFQTWFLIMLTINNALHTSAFTICVKNENWKCDLWACIKHFNNE